MLKHAKSIEAANMGVECMAEEKQNSFQEEAGIYAARKSNYKKAARNQYSKPKTTQQESCCTGCGKQEHMDYVSRKEKGPAWGKVCRKCGLRNHFSSVCHSKNPSALALIARSHVIDRDTFHDELLQLTITPLLKQNHCCQTVQIHVLPDT